MEPYPISPVIDDTTIVDVFARRVEQDAPRTALHVNDGGQFRSLTWGELDVAVHRAAAVLHTLNVRPGDRVVQYADNSAAWIVNDLAIQSLQAIHVPIHATVTAQQAFQQIEHCNANVVVLGDQTQVDELSTIASSLSGHALISSAPAIAKQSLEVLSMDELGVAAELPVGQRLAEDARRSLTPASPATVLYTSGTTGVPKGVLLTHGNIISNARATVDAFGGDPSETERRLVFLPLSHVFARTCDLYTWIVRGDELALNKDRRRIIDDCQLIHPTMINGVPYFFQRIHRYLVENGLDDQPGSLRKLLGGEIRLCGSGGAALPDYLYDFFQQHNIPLLQGYGMTESAPVITLNTPEAERRGTVGRPISNVKVRIADDGEVLACGPNVMPGYLHDRAETRRVIQDGWLHTGDVGHLDDDGYLKITGRKKELIVTAGGKNVPPVYLEALLTADPLIEQAVVIGDGRNYLTALIVPAPEQVKKALKRLRVLPISRRWVLTHPKILLLYRQCVEQRLSNVAPHERVRRFHLMDRGFTLESGEMTPKLSLRRTLITQNCDAFIESMYDRDAAPMADLTWRKHVVTFMRSMWVRGGMPAHDCPNTRSSS